MHVLIFGGSGLVGQHLAKHLEQSGHRVWIASRQSSDVNHGTAVLYQLDRVIDLLDSIAHKGDYAVINLAGQSLNSGRWTTANKHEILESRLRVTSAITEAISRSARPPRAMMNASAIGFYGYSDDETFTEASPNGDGFLADVTKRWEDVAQEASSHTRVVLARLGVVLGIDGGALPRMLAPYSWYVGGRVGTGKQWMSWVHIEDVCRIFQHCIDRDSLEGPVNVTAPAPETMNELGREIGIAMHRPHWMPAPSWALRLALGEMSDLVLRGQRVLPEKLLEDGYVFEFGSLRPALRDLLGSQEKGAI